MATNLRIPHGPLQAGAGMSGQVSFLNFLEDPPLPVCILMAALIADQSIPARLDERGCEISKPSVLSELWNREDAAVIERWLKPRFAPDQICDECGIRMGEDVPLEDLDYLEPQHIFAPTTSGIKSFFICEWCRETWECYGEAGLPNILTKL